MKLTDTQESIGFPIAGIKAMREIEKRCKDLEKEGWLKVPEWFPVPLPGYKYRFPGNYFAYMKPKPKLRHWLMYRFKGWVRDRIMKTRFKSLIKKEWQL